MKTYFMQVKLYTQFFLKIALSNKVTFLYTLGIPAVLLGLQLYNYQGSNPVNQTSLIFSWLAYMVINQALISTFFVAILREQGYLKQYHTIVKDPSIFFVSQLFVGLIKLVVSSLVLSIIASLIAEIAFLSLLAVSILTILMTFPPLAMLFSVFLTFQANRQTINTMQNAASMLSLLLLIVSQGYLIGNMSLLLDMINPLTMIVSAFYMWAEWNITQLLLAVVPVLVIYTFVGIVSLKRMVLLPFEA